MLFNSYEFICVFLPLALLGYYLAARGGRRLAVAWLVAASVFFYAWWSPKFVLLLLGSVTFNYGVSRLIARAGPQHPKRQTALLAGGIAGNLLLLFFFKYLFALLGFLNLRGHLPTAWQAGIVLPLGISFFTFTQIGYLIDSRQGMSTRHDALDYALFVTFFPHLIAGPILHNREMIPQFAAPSTYRFRLEQLTVGSTLFVFGLAKKVLIADSFASLADPGFAAPQHLSALSSWESALAYSLQLYFDFSGYSDMAIGLARMFGIRFPLNFASPYKAASIVEFWQRWHMTLTRYLNLYLYNPVAMWVTRRRLARNQGVSRSATRNLHAFATLTVLPTFYTMFLAGVWHGAGLQFAIFGLLHASYLSINHAWRSFGPSSQAAKALFTRAPLLRPVVLGASVATTYLAVLVAQIFFRADSTTGALALLARMLGLPPSSHEAQHPLAQPPATAQLAPGGTFAVLHSHPDLKILAMLAVGFTIVWWLPNTQQILARFAPGLGTTAPAQPRPWSWQPGYGWGVALGLLLLTCLFNLERVSRFLYFQF